MANGKNWIEIILMPIVIALVGIIGTYLITGQQEKNAKEKAATDRQIKILEIFSEKITSKDETQRLLALRLLTAVDAEFAAKLATAVSEVEPKQSAVGKVATQVAEEATARARDLPRIYIHIRKEEDRSAARSMGDKLKAAGFVVPGIERLVDIGPSTSELRYFKNKNKPEAESIIKHLSLNGVFVTLKYISGYEDSQVIQPRHYELWFAPGEPKR
jgi:membrane-associated protease RseP (regulator of RpoE activity)